MNAAQEECEKCQEVKRFIEDTYPERNTIYFCEECYENSKKTFVYLDMPFDPKDLN